LGLWSPFHDCHGHVVWCCGIGIIFMTKFVLQMVGSQILLKWAIVRWTESQKTFSQCSEVIIFFIGMGQGRGKMWFGPWMNWMINQKLSLICILHLRRRSCWIQNYKLSVGWKYMKIKVTKKIYIIILLRMGTDLVHKSCFDDYSSNFCFNPRWNSNRPHKQWFGLWTSQLPTGP
jgi:hypothetical protein